MDLPDAPIVSAGWLVARLNAPECVIVDTRKGDGYFSAHIPGAQRLALDPLFHLPGRVVEPDVFAAEMARLGIGPQTSVITYDDGNNLYAARLWWVLQHYGHAHARVLDGGWDGWVAAGLPVTDAAASPPEPGAFLPRVRSGHLAETADVRAAMSEPHRQFLDVRGEGGMAAHGADRKLDGRACPGRHAPGLDRHDQSRHASLPPCRRSAGTFQHAGATTGGRSDYRLPRRYPRRAYHCGAEDCRL